MKKYGWIIIVLLIAVATILGFSLHFNRDGENLFQKIANVVLPQKWDENHDSTMPIVVMNKENEEGLVEEVVLESVNENIDQVVMGVMDDTVFDSMPETQETEGRVAVENRGPSVTAERLESPQNDDGSYDVEAIKNSILTYSDIEALSSEQREVLINSFSSLTEYNDWVTGVLHRQYEEMTKDAINVNELEGLELE